MKPQRHRVKDWKNGRQANGKYVPFTARIIWYERGDGSDIRLQMEDSERQISVYPEGFMFRNQAAPPPGDPTPCVAALLNLIRDRLPVRIP